MPESDALVLPSAHVKSLVWEGDVLVDWVGGGRRFRLDGTVEPRRANYTYRFDVAAVSPDGAYQVLYERLGTKGLVLRHGTILREIDRSFYHASTYDYPVALGRLPSGRVVLAHCPEEYNELHLEDAETGERLTRRPSQAMDFFHSRLDFSPDGRFLSSAGWIWHPVDALCVFDVERALREPAHLDGPGVLEVAYTELDVQAATFLPGDRVAVASSEGTPGEAFGEDAEPYTCGLLPLSLGMFSLPAGHLDSLAAVGEPLGTLHTIGRLVLSLHEHPKLVDPATGRIVRRWPELHTGRQVSCLSVFLPAPPPPFALNPSSGRFAVADEENITVITVSDADR